MIHRCLVILLFFSLLSTLSSQNDYREENFVGLGFSYGLDIPAGDMADRFGANFRALLSLDIYNAKFNGTFGLEGGIIFGDNVNEDVLAPYRLDNGRIIGNNGQLADVFLRQRGAVIGLYASKNIIAVRNNPKAGLAIGLGVGLLQHNIRIQDDNNNTGQVTGDYAKGYDRNTMGPYIKQAIKYLHIGKSRSVNYEIALTFNQAFTKNTRAVNFDTQMPDDRRRLDLMIGLSAKWYLPIFDLRESEEVFY